MPSPHRSLPLPGRPADRPTAVIDEFFRLADLLDLRGETGAASSLRRVARCLQRDGLPPAHGRPQAWSSAGLDARTRWRADEILDGRGPILIAAAGHELPRDFQRLLQTTLLSAADLVLLHRQLGILTSGDLALALEGHVVAHHGVPEEVAARARRALQAAGTDARLTLGRAWDTVDPVLRALHDLSAVRAWSVAGSLRRVEPTVRDLRIVVAAREPEALARALDQSPQRLAVRVHGAAGLTVANGTREISVKIVPPEHYGGSLLFHTGSRAHLANLQRLAVPRGLRLTGEGFVSAEAPCPGADERAAYAHLDLPFIPAELRQGTDELERALDGTLPQLLERTDIRGDLHMHTNASDGRDSLEAMVETCASLGYEYIAITDHSQSAGASRTVSEDDLRRQMDQIDRLRERHPRLRILKGTEVDILPDGRLDFPDRLLERLDLVLASLHDAAGHSPARLLKRYRAAAEHPLVTIITHPANRLVGRYDGYDLDFDALFELAATTGTYLEVDGAPSHLDLDGALAHRAIAAGVLLSVDSDCHHARLLDRQMGLAVGTARRGWVEAHHVINTRPLAGLEALLWRKRGGTA
jgi:DNA polymerase (family X)